MLKKLFVALTVAMLISSPARSHDKSVNVLPVGDGKVSDSAKIGFVYSCRTSFRTGGPQHVGAWFKGDTWNPLEKPHVKGKVKWPDAAIAVTSQDTVLNVKSNGLPVGQPTGNFPISTDDPAYQYDPNPNPVLAQKLNFDIPATPVGATQPACLDMGMIGFTLTGVALYNALDAAGNDAAAHEVQDLCNGHPQGQGQYHYHNSSPCLPGSNSNVLVGWALDGYPVFGMRNSNGSRITNIDLDACHGRKEELLIDGRHYDYAYRLTMEYPYTLGCYHGQLMSETRASIRQSMGPPRRRDAEGRPPRQSR